MFFLGMDGGWNSTCDSFRFQISNLGQPFFMVCQVYYWSILVEFSEVSPKNWWHLYALIEASERVVTHPSESQWLCSRNNLPKNNGPVGLVLVSHVFFGGQFASINHGASLGRWDDPSWKESWKGLYKTTNYLVFQSKKWVVPWDWGCFSLAITKKTPK